MSSFDSKNNIEKIPDSLLVIPTVDVVVFPKMVVPLLVVDKNVISTLKELKDEAKYVFLVAAKDSADKDFQKSHISGGDLYSVGTICHIIRSVSLDDYSVKILIQGVCRAKLDLVEARKGALISKKNCFEFSKENQEFIDEALAEVLKIAESYQDSCRELGSDFQFVVSQLRDPERLVDFLIAHMSLDLDEAQELLERASVSELLRATIAHFKAFLERTSIKEDVRSSARNSINKNQREYFLREQLRAIKKELGEHEESEYEDLKEKIDSTYMSDEAKKEARKQFRRLEKMSPDSLEATVIRNHLEWLISMPWNKFIRDEVIDIEKAKKILDTEHFGLSSIKERILDYLSVKSFQSKYNAQILCLAGPPGVGKTSIGKSIAKALGRRYGRISLGGVYDESEIRGHRRTYVGALPGRIIQSIKKAGSSDPILIIDEIDKLGNSGRGDPAAALLEVLDPEQNANFYDNYLGVSFDLSNIMFIATCNDLSAMSAPLRDRMEIIQLPGYTSEEKIKIAKSFLVPRAISTMGLSEKNIKFQDDLIKEIVFSYTRESGVRELERLILKLCSKFARHMVEKKEALTFSSKKITGYLGPKTFRSEEKRLISKIGVTNGLAWTSFGGEILQVESVLMPGNGKLILTGQLGDVMKESAQAAISYARANAKEYGIDNSCFSKYDIHIHLPAGAIPKDGPSAGITLLSSILSAFTKRPVDATCAMTGELNLQGNVLPIGGLKEKLLAAQQHGLKYVILPEQNRRDLEADASFSVKNLELHFVKNVKELLSRVLLNQGSLEKRV